MQVFGKYRAAWSIVSRQGKTKLGCRRAKPTSSRPSASRSSTAASSATRSGFSIDRAIMAVPRRMRSVCVAGVGEKDQRRRQAAFVLMKMVLSDPRAVESGVPAWRIYSVASR